MNTVEKLNRIYEPLCLEYKNIEKYLTNNSYRCTTGFYNNHSIKDINNNWITEYFPIPVITVDKLCDICINLD